MTQLNKISLIISIIPLFFCLSCQKLELVRITKITTGSITDTKQTSCTVGGSVIEISEEGVTQHGHCWSITTNPSINNNTTQLGSITSTGNYTSNLTGLNANTKYFIRAYAIDDKGIYYGNEVNFTTLTSIVSSLTTSSVSNITANSATCGGNITDDGGSAVTARGVCWSTNQNPTVADSHTTDGSGSGSFTSNLTGLAPGVTYYIRAYATNNAGTAYGNQVSFTILLLPAATTNSATNVSVTSATLNGTVNASGQNTTVTFEYGTTNSYGSTVTASQSPVTGSANTSVSAAVTGLTANTTYHFRVKAESTAGTTYGSDRTFKTISDITVTDIDGNTYHVVQIGTQFWMQENLKTTKYNDATSIPLVTNNTEWSNLTSPGYCWYNNDVQTYKDTYGALYNWYALNTGKLCPTGWHIPTDTEWTTLTDYLGGTTVAGDKLKETGTTQWISPNTGATNESGFTALPGGYRNSYGTFGYVNNCGYWWSATEYDPTYAWSRYLYYNLNDALRNYYNKNRGFSVRCLKD